MIRLQMVAPKPKKSPEQQVQDAQWVSMLLDDARFASLIESMADNCILAWAESKSLEERERAFTLMSGLKMFETELQKILDAGVRAAKSGATS
jgi:hypothetical protein